MNDPYFQTLVGTKEDILGEMLAHPGFIRTGGSVEQAMKAALSAAELRCVRAVVSVVEPQLADVLDTHYLLHGDADSLDDANADEWHSALDDAVEAVFAPWESVTSASWRGERTVDTRLHEENAVHELAQKAGFEVFRELSAGRTPAKVLSALGVVQGDIETALAQIVPRGEGANVDIATIVAVLSTVLDMAEVTGRPLKELKEEIDLMSDTDATLADGAAERCGISTEDAAALCRFRVSSGVGAVDTLYSMLETLDGDRGAFDGMEAPPDVGGDGTAPVIESNVPQPTGAGLPPEVLAAIRDHTPEKDKDVADALNVSRQTFINKVNGKGDPITDPAQVAAVRGILQKHLDGLTAALALIDGA